MKRQVQWSRSALDDIKEQSKFIAAENPSAARKVADRVNEAAKALGDMATGRPGRVVGTYEKSVYGLPYIIAYSVSVQVGQESIIILRVIHTARDWQSAEWPQ